MTQTKTQIQDREYQNVLLQNIFDTFKTKDSILLQLPTGGGKSIITTKFILEHKNKKILILAHRRRLLLQMKEHIENQGLKTGLIVAEIEEGLQNNIVIASIKTVARDKRIDSILNQQFDYVIIDEAHHSMTGSYQKLLINLRQVNPNFKLLGVTATPYRMDLLPLSENFTELIVGPSIQELINKKFLCNYRVFYQSVGEIDSEVVKIGNEYQLSSLSTYMRKKDFIDKAILGYKELGEERQTIVFCVDKKHARDVEKAYHEAGYTKTGYIDSDILEDKREEILQAYERGELTHLICIETLTEGVDLPETGCIQLLRPTQSIILYLQMVGRGLRPKSDGSDLIILDCSNNTRVHGTPASPREWSLDPKVNPNNPRKKRKVVSKREDGTFTENEEEMELGELVELSEEEYITNIAGSIEKLEEENKEIDRRIISTKLEGIEYLVDTLRKKYKYSDDEVKVKEDKYCSQYSLGVISFVRNKDYDSSVEIEFTFDKNYKNAISVNCLYFSQSVYRTSTLKETQQKLKFNIFIGQLSEVLLDEKVTTKLLAFHREYTKLEGEKHDIGHLREVIKKAKEVTFLRKLDEYVEKHGELVFDIEDDRQKFFLLSQLNRNWSNPAINPYQYQRSEWGKEADGGKLKRREFIEGNRLHKIIFSKNKLTTYNDAKFVTFNGRVLEETSNQNLYKEKLVEELKRINYEIPKI